MNQKEFDWLSNWMKVILNRAGIDSHCDIVDGATGDRPPPIDEEVKTIKVYCPHCQTEETKVRLRNIICPQCGKDVTKPPIDNSIATFHGWTCEKHKIQVAHNKECYKCVEEITEEEPKRNPTDPLPWGQYYIRLDTEGAVILNGAIPPRSHAGHKVDLVVQHSPKPTCHAIGTEVHCQNCKISFSTSSQFLEKIQETLK